eukprot:2616990-Karenia_brevis.AAC.1
MHRAQENDNGLAIHGLQELAAARGWEFNPDFLEDACVGGGSETKKMVIEHHFKSLPHPTVVYYFDDLGEHLQYVRENATVPTHIDLKTVLFDWYGLCIDGTQTLPLKSR